MVGKTDSDKAIADFSRAIEKDPRCVTPAYFYRAPDAAHSGAPTKTRLADWTAALFRSMAITPTRRDESLARMLATCLDASIRDGKRSVAEATLRVK